MGTVKQCVQEEQVLCVTHYLHVVTMYFPDLNYWLPSTKWGYGGCLSIQDEKIDIRT